MIAAALFERVEGGAQLLLAPCAGGGVIGAAVREARRVRDGTPRQQTLVDQPVEADQQRVPRERREGAVRRVPVTDRSGGQHLPEALPRARQPPREGVRLRPEIAAPVSAGQGSRVKEDAACPLAQD